MSAWNAVNEANTPGKMFGSATNGGKRGLELQTKESGCRFKRTGLLAQMWQNIMWLVSSGYRDRKSDERATLLDMMEGEIRANCATAQSRLRKTRDEEPDNLVSRDFEVTGTASENGNSPEALPEAVEEALDYAREHVRDQRVFIDALHRVFLEAAGSLVSDKKNSLFLGEVSSSSVVDTGIGTADRDVLPSREAGNETVGNALSAALLNEELKLKKCRDRVPPKHFLGCTILPNSQRPRENHPAYLGWQIQFKIKNRLSDAEMTTILDSISKNEKQLSVTGQCQSSEEFLGAMKDISASATATYEALSKNVSRGKRRCRNFQSFLDVYVQALHAVTTRDAEEKMDPCGALRDHMHERQDDFCAAYAAYAVTEARAKSGLTLSFAATEKIANREDLKQALDVTSSVRKALGLELLQAEKPRSTLTDAEVLRLTNSGIRVRGRKIENTKGSIRVFPDQTIARITKELATLKNCAPHKDTGICENMYLDLNRQGMILGEQRLAPDSNGRYGANKEWLLSRLRDFCRDDKTGNVNKNMLMAISQVTHQGFPACLLVELNAAAPLHPALIALIGEHDSIASDYWIEKDENGDVFIECVLTQKGGTFMVGYEEDDAPLLGDVTIRGGSIDTENGAFLRRSIKVKIAKESYSRDGGMNARPQLVDICYDYNYKMR